MIPVVGHRVTGFVLLVGLLPGCGGPPPLNVLLVTLDTTRADHLGCYGHPDAATPNLDWLAAEGLRYEWAFTPVPITLPSHLSILSGTAPPFHGVRENAGFYVPEELETMAEILGRAGWRTAACVGAFPLDSQTGIDQGFDHFDDAYPSSLESGNRPGRGLFFDERPAADVTAAALRWLAENGDRPFFLWAHFFDPHQPYSPPSPYRETFSHSPYDGEIASMDEAVGRLVRHLRDRRLLDRTLIVVVADHGEGLGDHGEPTHALLLHSSTVRVPLILRDPRTLEARVISRPVSTLDILPTVLEALGLAVPDRSQGRSLPREEGEPKADDRALYAETLFGALLYGWSPLEKLIQYPWAVIDAPEPLLYRIDNDPGEISNLAHTEPKRLKMMLDALERRREDLAAEGFAYEETHVSESTRARLAALGYLSGGFAMDPTTEDPEDGGPDPAVMMPIFGAINESFNALNSRQFSLAVGVLERVLRDDPGNPTIMTYLSHARVGHGDTEGALSELARLVAMAPDNFDARIRLAGLLRWSGRNEEALTHLEEAVRLDSRHLSARLALASLLEDLKSTDSAEEHYREIVAVEPDHHLAANRLAGLLYREERLAEAVLLLDRLLESQPYFAPAVLNRAVFALDEGRPELALETARRAERLRPEDLRAPEVIAIALEELGRGEEAGVAWEEVLSRAPDGDARVRAEEALERLKE